MTWYNDSDPFCNEWIDALMREGLLPAGTVDGRDFRDVAADDVREHGQCHWFAGIGGWALALDLAGWPPGEPAWTASLPCQPFSAAGKQRGADDERHLWPAFQRLVSELRPPVVFGEQVGGRLGREWLAGVRSGLEGLGYAVGAADLPACAVGAPHIRSRLYWVADAAGGRWGRRAAALGGGAPRRDLGDRTRHEGAVVAEDGGGARHGAEAGAVGHADGERLEGPFAGRGRRQGDAEAPGPWGGAEWVECADGRARRVEPGVPPLAHGVPARVGRLRAYGNAVVPQVAAAFVTAFAEARDGVPGP